MSFIVVSGKDAGVHCAMPASVGHALVERRNVVLSFQKDPIDNTTT